MLNLLRHVSRPGVATTAPEPPTESWGLSWLDPDPVHGAAVLAAARARVAHLADPEPPLLLEPCGCTKGQCLTCVSAMSYARRDVMEGVA